MKNTPKVAKEKKVPKVRKPQDKWNKDRTIDEVLKPLFKLGYSVNKACDYSGIPRSTVQDWVEKDNPLRLKIQVWRNEVSLKARKNLVAEVLGKEAPNDIKDPSASVPLSHVWLKSFEKEDFTERTEVVSANVTYEQLLTMQEANREEAKKIDESRKPKKGLYDRVRNNPKK